MADAEALLLGCCSLRRWRVADGRMAALPRGRPELARGRGDDGDGIALAAWRVWRRAGVNGVAAPAIATRLGAPG